MVLLDFNTCDMHVYVYQAVLKYTVAYNVPHTFIADTTTYSSSTSALAGELK